MISGNVGGTEVAITGTQSGTHTYLDVNPLLPNLPKIEEIPVVTANTPLSHALPANTRKFMVYAEDNACLKMGFISGGPTITIGCGDNFVEDGVNAGSVTLYLESESIPCTIKVVSWAVS